MPPRPRPDGEPATGPAPAPGPTDGLGTCADDLAQATGTTVPAARAVLHRARRARRPEGVHVVRGAGEGLPFRDAAFGTVLVVVTLCFADDPAALLREARRVLRPGGGVVLGDAPAPDPVVDGDDPEAGFVAWLALPA